MAAYDALEVDEESGLLADEEEGRGGLVGTKMKERANSSSSSSGDSVFSRAATAWRQPVETTVWAPAWLTGRLVLTKEEQECLSQLRQLADVAYNGEDPTHERTLRRLFAAVHGAEEAHGLTSGGDARWKDLGFQAEDPRTDFRGGGLMSLQNMCHLAENYPDQFSDMVREANSKRASYLFAACCVNISSMLVLLLGLNTRRGLSPAKGMPCPANAIARKNFAKILSSEAARNGDGNTSSQVLAELFACAVMKLHAEWQALCSRKPGVTLLDFGEALSATAIATEHMLDTLQGGDTPIQSVFAVLDFVNSGHWWTRCRLYLYRAMCISLEFMCRLIAAVRALLVRAHSEL